MNDHIWKFILHLSESAMIGLNDTFPHFSLKVAKDGEISTISSDDLKGRWSVVFFYPEDFSFICPTEVTGFEAYREYFEMKETTLIGISTDDVETHVKWQKEVDVHYPLATDQDGTLAKSIGVLDENDGRAHRATFILDPDLKVQFLMINTRNVGRSVEETIRVYHAIHSGRMCPADYKVEGK